MPPGAPPPTNPDADPEPRRGAPADAGGGVGADAGEGSAIRHAIPLAIAAALVGLVSLLTTVFVAHVLSTRGYGTLIDLLGLFLVVSMPGSALLVGVVRRSSAWEARGLGARIKPWVARIHRIGEVSLLGMAVVMWLIRVPVAHALSLPGPSGVAEILTAGGVWILVSIDRGLLQVRRDYLDLSVNLVLEAFMRLTLTIALASAFGVEGAALGILFTELVTATHARITSARALARAAGTTAHGGAPADGAAAGVPTGGPADGVSGEVAGEYPADEVPEIGVEATGGAVALAVHGGRDLLADVLTALGSLVLLAILQNADVILLGSRAPHHSGAYAAISVPAKALVFGALVLVNYLLPEATIRHQQGMHALKQLGHTFLVLALPCSVLLVLSVFAPHRLLSLVFGHRLTAAASAFSTLVLAMVMLSVTVVLTVYLLGVGWRWVVAVLAGGTGALVAAAAAAGGRYTSTARADLVVQFALAATMAACFVGAHRQMRRRRAGPAGPAGPVAGDALPGSAP